MATCVFEECLDKLCIMGRVDVENNFESKILAELRMSFKEKYSKGVHHLLYDPNTLKLIEESEHSPEGKLKRELIFLVKLLYCIKNDIKIARICDNLEDCIYYYNKRRSQEEANLTKNKFREREVVMMSFLSSQDNVKDKFCHNLTKLHSEILKDKIFGTALETGIQLRFVDNYERARREQMTIMLRGQERTLKRKVVDLNSKIKEEDACFRCKHTFLLKAVDDLSKQVPEWSDK